jgi:hypothetical protein
VYDAKDYEEHEERHFAKIGRRRGRVRCSSRRKSEAPG